MRTRLGRGPPHATIHTGLAPREYGVRDDGMALPGEVPVPAESLAAAGYRTWAAVGVGVLGERHGPARGFEAYDDQFGADAEEFGSVGLSTVAPAPSSSAPSACWRIPVRGHSSSESTSTTPPLLRSPARVRGRSGRAEVMRWRAEAEAEAVPGMALTGDEVLAGLGALADLDAEEED